MVNIYNWGMQSKNGLKNVWGNIMFFIQLDVIVHKKIFSVYKTY